MCEAMTIASMALSGLSAGAKFMMDRNAASQQAAQQRNMANYQAAVARNNQELALRQARDAEERGRMEEQRMRSQNANLRGTQQAALAASGVALDPGTSALDVLSDTAAIGELDALTIRDNAAREAWRFRVDATNSGNEVGLQTSVASNARVSPMTGVGSLLTSTSQIADRWSAYRRQSALASG